MNFKKTLLAVALASASASAYAIPTVMTVTSGQFGMGFFTGGGFMAITHFGSGALDITDQYNAPGWNTSAAQQTGAAPGSAATGSIASFQFGAAQVNTYTAAVATQAVAGGGPIPVFPGAGNTLSNGGFVMDMSSFFANWNGTDFSQGNAAVAGTLSNCTAGSLNTCNFSMSWQSLITGGPFDGNTGSWVLAGTVAAVPEASTYGMMAAGLALVGFVARRRTRGAV